TLTYGELKLKMDDFSLNYSYLKGKRCAISTDSRVSLAIYLPCVESLSSLIFLQPKDCTDSDLCDFYLKSNIEYRVVICNDEIIVESLVDTQGEMKSDDSSHWLLATSGTSGTPKLALYTLKSLLSSSIKDLSKGKDYIWGVCYDLNRFSGLQVYFQALSSGSCLVIHTSNDLFSETIKFYLNCSVNALSATPSYWRKLLMTPISKELNLKVISLGGEISDQPILDGLSSVFRDAKIVHIYASTEAGVGFSVKDNLEGFPLAYIESQSSDLTLKIIENELWIRSNRGASALLKEGLNMDIDGYINSGDLVEVIGDRVLFRGRSSGTINVGGNKVIPEEVERVLNSLKFVASSKVSSQKSAFLGALVVAEIVLNTDNLPSQLSSAEIKKLASTHCRNKLESFKVPAVIKIVESIDIGVTGKMLRNNLRNL
ncbi:AMP-binding protein, partial [Shewanella sp. GutDb-MelDb]|uniref:AMP-binding protein n=1 Tax=Shewanella sp. GutDb-MelDb TaxID=2058316 RepID=UPI000C7C17D0